MNRTWIALGGLTLLAGAAVYLTDLRPGPVYFIPHGLPKIALGGSIPAVLHGCLPAFAHVFAFTLITAGVLTVSRKGGLIVALAWCVADIAFEVGQHPAIAPRITRYLPGWFSGIPFLENTRCYFSTGSFAAGDVISILLGALVAYSIIVVTSRKGDKPWVAATQ